MSRCQPCSQPSFTPEYIASDRSAEQTPDMMTDSDATIGEAFLARVRETPKGVAQRYRDENGRWQKVSWEALQTEVQRCAGLMRALGLQRGERMAIVAGTRREWQIAELAGYLNGAAVSGIDPHTPASTTARLFDQIRPAGLVVQDVAALNTIPEAQRASAKFIFILDAPEHPSSETALRGTVIFWKHIQTFPYRFEENGPTQGSPLDAAAVIHTSGSMGPPKPIAYSHAQLLTAAKAIGAAFSNITHRDRQLCWLPLSHLFQRNLNLACMLRGVASWYCEDPRQIMNCIQEVQPSFLICVPRFLEKLQEGILQRIHGMPCWQKQAALDALQSKENSGLERSLSLPSLARGLFQRWVKRALGRVLGKRLKFVITGSAPTPPATLAFFKSMGLPVLEAYGLSENAVPMAINTLRENRIGSVGKPLPLNQIQTANDGEILVKGPGVFSGYMSNKAEGTDASQRKECFTDEGFLKTGDLGHLDKDGYLFLTGRKKETIKTSTGRNISPSQIEAVYRSCPGVEELAVFGHGRPYLVALMAAGVGWQNKTRLRTELKKAESDLAPYARVRKFLILPEPFSIERGELTPSMKLRRTVIEQRYRTQLDRLYQDAFPDVLQDLSVCSQEANGQGAV